MLQLSWRKLLFFFMVFLPVGAIGTVLHEFGHFVVMDYYGFEPKIHYAFASYHANGYTGDKVMQLYQANKDAIENEKDFPEKVKYDCLVQQLEFEYHLVTWGGVLQTILTGTLGFFLLWWSRKRHQWRNILLRQDILFIIMALFWSREVFNLLSSLLINGHITPESNWDEVRLSLYWNLPHWFLPIIFGILGLLVCVLVVFRFCPPSYRKELFLGGGSGSVLGGIVWLFFLGQLVMP